MDFQWNLDQRWVLALNRPLGSILTFNVDPDKGLVQESFSIVFVYNLCEWEGSQVWGYRIDILYI